MSMKPPFAWAAVDCFIVLMQDPIMPRQPETAKNRDRKLMQRLGHADRISRLFGFVAFDPCCEDVVIAAGMVRTLHRRVAERLYAL